MIFFSTDTCLEGVRSEDGLRWEWTYLALNAGLCRRLSIWFVGGVILVVLHFGVSTKLVARLRLGCLRGDDSYLKRIVRKIRRNKEKMKENLRSG